MEKLLAMVLTSTLGLAGLTGISQAQQELSAGENYNEDNIVEVDISDPADEIDGLDLNIDNMLKLLDQLQADEGLSKDSKVTGQGKEDVNASNHPDLLVKPDKNLDPTPAPIEKKAAKNHIEPGNEVVKFVLKDSDNHFRLGMDYWRSKNLDEAIQNFEEVVRLDPNNANAYWNLGLLYEAKNMGPEALDSTKKAEAIYSKYDYSLYVAQAKKRLEKLANKFNTQ